MVQLIVNALDVHPLIEMVIGLTILMGGSALMLIIGAYIGNTIDIMEEHNMSEKLKQFNIDKVKKNEYGQYIVDDLNKQERGRLYRATEHPCSQWDEFKCLDCPYTDCIAPAYINSKSSGDFTRMKDGIKGEYESPYLVRNPMARSGKRGNGPRSIVHEAIKNEQ